ncbi:hypothetical protein AAC387_Pa04g1635 [Persea americana]
MGGNTMGMKSNCNDDDENFDMVSAKQSKQYDLMPKDRILDIIEDWIVVVDPLQEDTLKSEKILDPILLDLMSEDMVKDGYEDIMNIDISPVAIDMMRKKYENIPHLKYMQMDVRDMSFFPDESFDSVIDKGTLDSLMCGTTAPISVSQMLGEVSRLLKPGGVYMLITYGDPTVRIPHLNRQGYGWKIILHIICEFLLRKDLS